MTIKLTPDQFAGKLSAVGKLAGQPLFGFSGSISHSGVTVAYSYDSVAGALVLNVTKKPFFVTEAYVEQQITAWFAGS